MTPIDVLFKEYDQTHRHPTNQIFHLICLPPLIWSILGILWSCKFSEHGILNGATIVVPLVVLYYFTISNSAAFLMMIVGGCMLALCAYFDRLTILPVVSIVTFFVAWTGQLMGYRYEGVRPTFFRDIQLLLIAPLWILARFMVQDPFH